MSTSPALTAPGVDPGAVPVRPPVRPPDVPAVRPTPAAGEGVSVKAPAPAVPRVQYDPEKMMANLKEAIDHLNKQMASSGRTLGFAMDDVLRTPVVTVKDTKSGEVIRQIPSETVIRVAHTLEDLKGLLYDQSS